MPYLYQRRSRTYWWDPEHGEVCVEIDQKTPAKFYLWHCDTGEKPREMFWIVGRFNDPELYAAAKAIKEGKRGVVSGAPGGPSFLQLLWGQFHSPVEVYFRDGLKGWTPRLGEFPARVKDVTGNSIIIVGPKRGQRLEIHNATQQGKNLRKLLSKIRRGLL